MSGAFDPAPAAALLRAARGGERLDALAEAIRPRDVHEGYALQRRLARELGEPLAGYKLGLSSEAAMGRTGLGVPVVGFMPSQHVHRSGDVLAMPREGTFLIEVEIAFRLRRPLTPGTGRGEVRDAVASAHLVLEIVRSRFKDRNAAGLPSFIGDGSGFHALIVGDAVAPDDVPALVAQGATLLRDGEVAAAAAVGPESPDPFEALARFATVAHAYDLALDEGMMVATGDLVAPFETAGPGLYEGRLSSATVRFEGRPPSA